MAVKYYLKQTVLEAAKERIAYLFDEFEHVVVGYSAGKDSTVVFELALEEAQKRGRLPLDVMFLDQEAEWQATVDLTRKIRERPGVRLHWLQVPIKLFNATSSADDWLQCWTPGEEDKWMRPKEPGAVTENVYGTDRFAEMFTAWMRYHYAGKKACYLSGVRTEESPTRMMGLTHMASYKWITWGKKLTPGLHWTFYPIYDWSWTDVWKAILDHKWPYNKVYDYQYRYGVSINDMRVSNVHHETAVKALFWLQEIEPETYAKLTQRIGGVDMAGKMGTADFFVRKLPHMFRGWKEYRDHLLKNLIDEQYHAKFIKHFEKQDRMYQGHHGDKLYRAQVQTILANDHHLTKLGNFDHTPESAAIRRRLKDAQAAAEEKNNG